MVETCGREGEQNQTDKAFDDMLRSRFVLSLELDVTLRHQAPQHDVRITFVGDARSITVMGSEGIRVVAYRTSSSVLQSTYKGKQTQQEGYQATYTGKRIRPEKRRKKTMENDEEMMKKVIACRCRMT